MSDMEAVNELENTGWTLNRKWELTGGQQKRGRTFRESVAAMSLPSIIEIIAAFALWHAIKTTDTSGPLSATESRNRS